MSTTADVGRNVYDQVISDGRLATKKARESLRRIIDETPGPQTTAMLLAATAVQIGKIDEALNELDNIGHKAKNLT